MVTIAKVSDGASASSALNYALGKGKAMHNDTERWLEEQQLVRPDELKDCRAVAVGGTNGIDPVIAKEQFKAVRQAFGQDKRCNQVLRIIQSFALNELDPTNPSDWQRANDLGCELAEKLYPQYQCAVYTQIDGKNHVIHNHINVNKVNLETGKKLDERKGTAVERARKVNDEIARNNGWKVIPPVREHKSKTEQDLTKKGQYSYMADLRGRIDSVMADTSVSDFKTFSERLEQSEVHVSVRGKNISYMFLDANNKQRRARGKRLGTDYDKEAITHELESRIGKQKTYGREPELAIEKQSMASDLQQSKNELGQSEESKRIAEKDQRTADSQQSIIAEFVGSFERKADELRKRFERVKSKIRAKISSQSFVKQAQQEPYTLQFNSKLTGPDDFVTVNPKTKTIGIGNSQGSNIKKIPEKTTILKRNELKDEIARLSDSYHVLNDISMQEKGSLDDIKAFNDELPENAILEKPKQPKKPIELDKYGLSMKQRHSIDAGNKILREHGLGDLQMGYDGKTLRENEAEKNHKVAKPLEKKLTKGQIQTVYFANKKYLSAGLPSYRINYDGLSYKYDVKFQKQQRQKSAENQVAQSQQQSKKQPTRRHVSRRLQIKHNNQNQNKNIDRGPKM